MGIVAGQLLDREVKPAEKDMSCGELLFLCESCDLRRMHGSSVKDEALECVHEEDNNHIKSLIVPM